MVLSVLSMGDGSKIVSEAPKGGLVPDPAGKPQIVSSSTVRFLREKGSYGAGKDGIDGDAEFL